jgi:hypothetical protein
VAISVWSRSHTKHRAGVFVWVEQPSTCAFTQKVPSRGAAMALDLVYPNRLYCRMQRKAEKPSFQLIFLHSAYVRPE